MKYMNRNGKMQTIKKAKNDKFTFSAFAMNQAE